MSTALKELAATCIALTAIEVAGRLCTENEAVNFVKALAITVLIISVAANLFSSDFTLAQPSYQAEQTASALTEYLQEETQRAAESDFTEYITGLLATINLQAEKITVGTDITDDNSIVLTKVTAEFTFDSDAQLAHTLLTGTLGDGVEVTAKANGH